MAISQYFTDSWTNGGGTGLSATVLASGDVEVNQDFTMLSGVNTFIPCAISASGLVGVFILSDQPVRVNLATATSLYMNSGVPLTWNKLSPITNPWPAAGVVSGITFNAISGAISPTVSLRTVQQF